MPLMSRCRSCHAGLLTYLGWRRTQQLPGGLLGISLLDGRYAVCLRYACPPTGDLCLQLGCWRRGCAPPAACAAMTRTRLEGHQVRDGQGRNLSVTNVRGAAGPIMPEGSSAVSLTYLASEKVVPGYGGGMSSAKAQLESDTKVGAAVSAASWSPLAQAAGLACAAS